MLGNRNADGFCTKKVIVFTDFTLTIKLPTQFTFCNLHFVIYIL